MFSKFFKQQTDFEKALFNSSILNSKPFLNIGDLKQLMQGFPQQQQQLICRTPQPIKKTFQKFFQSLPDKVTYRVKLKILATCHVLLDDFLHGEQFSESLLDWDGFRYKEKNQDKEKFIMMYFEMLQRFANGLHLLKMAKSQKTYTLDSFIENQSNYYKAINLLTVIFTYTSIIKSALDKHQEEIIGEIVLLIWNDVIAIYLFFEKIIMEFILDFQTFQSTIFFQVYNLIPDYIRLTQQIQQFYKLNDHFQEEKQFTEPQWKILDQKMLDELEQFKQRLKIQSARGRLVKKKSKASFSTQLLSPQHQSSGSFLFGNTTLGYIKRLSTVDDPFDNSEEVSKKYKILIK
ncbi:unnamed protein product [Paramecium pentaurelia]|uniref:Uncharacterized protein n=1 Tax=Paramecium pentaurelia TaxID=43138 RepID=A0A8S1RUQ0_9CILI|nr:unnamed protein product [Paramecium pentaurelia]